MLTFTADKKDLLHQLCYSSVLGMRPGSSACRPKSLTPELHAQLNKLVKEEINFRVLRKLSVQKCVCAESAAPLKHSNNPKKRTDRCQLRTVLKIQFYFFCKL